MKKKSLLYLFPLMTAVQFLFADESMSCEQVEIVIRVNRPCSDDDLARQAWDRMVEDASSVASACQGCTNSRTFEPMVEAMCSCIREIGNVMNNDPEVHGEITITVKDEMAQGFRGQVRREN